MVTIQPNAFPQFDNWRSPTSNKKMALPKKRANSNTAPKSNHSRKFSSLQTYKSKETPSALSKNIFVDETNMSTDRSETSMLIEKLEDMQKLAAAKIDYYSK